MDWAKDGKGNRNPVVVINKKVGINIIKLSPRQGKTVTVDASKSIDPDGDKLTYKWWIQPEAGTYKNNITIKNGNSGIATIEIPSESAGKIFHIICEVTDNGMPNLTSYRRIVFEPTK
jgi:hypothetical protein